MVLSWVAASSTASEMAIPRLPPVSGCSFKIALPALVSSLGLATHSAPQTCMMDFRYGFWSKEARTM